MNQPSNIQRYVKLIVDKELPQNVVGDWFRAIKTTVPNGVLTTYQTTAEDGLKSASLVHRVSDETHEYVIPLVRDLGDTEIEPAVEAFAAQHPDVDYDIEVSSAQTSNVMDIPKVEIRDDSFAQLCTAWAKKQHDAWFKERTDAGWRYGLTMSIRDKVHPLLRQWHELPDKYRKVDHDQPQGLLDLLNDQGYAVIAKSELEAMLNLLRNR